VAEKQERIITFERKEEDLAFEGLRPKTFKNFIGQDKIKENLLIHISAVTSSSTARLDWERPLWRTSLPMK
jgi:Holliday junction resolvasome RuvABC ATP-dependent DNA helicase subunit